MNNLSIKNKLYIGFGSLVAIILLLLVMAYNNFASLTAANRWDKHTLEVLLELDRYGIGNVRMFAMRRVEELSALEQSDKYPQEPVGHGSQRTPVTMSART